MEWIALRIEQRIQPRIGVSLPRAALRLHEKRHDTGKRRGRRGSSRDHKIRAVLGDDSFLPGWLRVHYARPTARCP